MNIIKPSKPQFEPSRDELALTKTEPFFDLLKSIIEESTEEAKKNGRNRKGTLFTPTFTIFLVLNLVMRHDLSGPKVLEWLISGVRFLTSVHPETQS